jgi:hypothetical protein
MALPKTFTGGERLFAGDLNDNFEALDTRLVTAEFDVDTLENNAVSSADVDDIVVLTQSAYDGLTPDASTLYVIVG